MFLSQRVQRWALGILWAGVAVVILAGCATPYFAQMSPEQLQAYAKIKEAGWGCIFGVYAGANVLTTWGNTDKGIIGTLSIGKDCTVTYSAPPVVVKP